MVEKIDTNRLQLHEVVPADLVTIHKLLSIPKVDQYNTLGIPTNIEVTQVYLEEWIDNRRLKNEFVFAIKKMNENELLGLISLKIGNPKYRIGMIWYKLFPDFWFRGYATEATKAILEFGFEKIGLHRIEAGCAVDNIGSVKVLEKTGMVREGLKRKVLPLKSGWSDTYEYAILETEWNT
ncbi:GNAT family N-acetyltransferase [Aquimarina sp. RZ0]|uniref:GNAT family N-acetyltransferase n=1 Tax=Aquimarina sp. RZ0 TaxID=2607730 RepID=UPI0011F24180|nr:GNAT family protein [Aquimarina sp. RZ0]KAA1243963.1 GNAT family N-acetyltransferase [Aquimarina sp. RZ0]